MLPSYETAKIILTHKWIKKEKIVFEFHSYPKQV